MIDKPRRNFILKDALAEYSAHGASDFSYVLIDCPPSLTLLTVNAMAAADAVMVPLQCEFYALEGLTQLMGTIARVQRALNPRLELQGVLLTMHDARNNLSDSVAGDVRDHFAGKVFDTVIPRNVRVSEAPSYGKPVLIYDHRCAGAQAYIQLLIMMFIADCVEYGQWKLGRRNESVTFSLQPFLYKAASAAASGIVGLTLIVSGINEADGPADLDSSGIALFKVAMFGVPVLGIAVSWVMVRRKYVLDEDTYANIVAELRERERAAGDE